MVTPWTSKGCEVCRGQWENGSHPPELAVSDVLHSRLHRCEACGSYWEQHERYADTMSENDMKKLYPQRLPARNPV
jgi:hypothetical protein